MSDSAKTATTDAYPSGGYKQPKGRTPVAGRTHVAAGMDVAWMAVVVAGMVAYAE